MKILERFLTCFGVRFGMIITASHPQSKGDTTRTTIEFIAPTAISFPVTVVTGTGTAALVVPTVPFRIVEIIIIIVIILSQTI